MARAPSCDPRAWLTTVATRRLVDARRSEAARLRREEVTYAEPRPAGAEEGDDTLFLLFCCCHPDLTPASQVALTLRAVGGLTTREIADAFYVPEATMAQRISRAKRDLRGRRLDQPGDVAVVLRVLYLVYTTGHAGRVDLAGEAIRLARQLTLATEEPEARGLLALMLLNHARRPARLDSSGRIVTLDRQDRSLWDTREIAEGVRVLQSALAAGRPGRYQVEAAIAALHDDAASAEETDWPQILAWYDDLVALTDDPVRQDPAAVLGRSVAVGHVLGVAAGLRETDRLRDVIGERHRWHAVRGYLHELGGDLRPPPRRTPRPPAGPRTPPSATTWSVRPPAPGPPSRLRGLDDLDDPGGGLDHDRLARTGPDPEHLLVHRLRRVDRVEVEVDQHQVGVVGGAHHPVGPHAGALAVRGIAVEHLLPPVVVLDPVLDPQRVHAAHGSDPLKPNSGSAPGTPVAVTSGAPPADRQSATVIRRCTSVSTPSPRASSDSPFGR